MYSRQGEVFQNVPASRPPPSYLNRPPPFLRDLPTDLNGQPFYPETSYSNRNNNNIEIITQDLRLGSERRSERSRFERDHERDFRRVEGIRDCHPARPAEYYDYPEVRTDLSAYGQYSRYDASGIATAGVPMYAYETPFTRLPPARGYDRRTASFSPSSRGSIGGRSRSCSSRSSVSRASSYGSSISKDGSYRARGSRKRKASRTKDRVSKSGSSRRSRHRRRSSRHRSKERSRDRSRERSRDRPRNRERSRTRSRDRSRDRARSKGRDRDRRHSRHKHSGRGSSVASSWKDETPNKIVMLRGLGFHVLESEIFNDISACALEARDVRIIRNRETGLSRGIAFVEFKDVSDASKWMDMRQGCLIIGEDRVRMHYNIPKDGDRGSGGSGVIKLDWNCIKCAARNFRRRDFCYKCEASRSDADQSKYLDGYEEIGIAPRSTLLFRNLDVLTTEEKILTALQSITALPIKHIRVAKDPLNGISRGYCFVELNSTAESVALHDRLHALDVPLYVDGRIVSVTYARQSIGSLGSATSSTVASTAMAAAQWTNQMPTTVPTYEARTTVAPGFSAPVSTATASVSYGSQQIYGGSVEYSRPSTSANATTSKAAATDAVTISSAPVINLKAIGVMLPDGKYPKFATPDVSTYQYDKATGYYYDPSTGLHYDANSQYYFNSQTQQFLYWDGEKLSYLPAAAASADSGSSVATGDATDKSATAEAAASNVDGESMGGAAANGAKKPKEKDRQDKVKIAKKIAKDMEKWAKTLNQKKENAKQGIVANQSFAVDSLGRQSATADAGFAVLEKKATLAERQAAVMEALKKKDVTEKQGNAAGLVASYGGDGSDTDEDGGGFGGNGGNPLDENRLLDWQKLACLLCKRQFPTKEALVRHQQLSDLHKQNMDALKASTEAKYRDRAKERRVKYGEPDNPPPPPQPPPDKFKDMFAAPNSKINYEQPTKRGIGASNVGNKMLKAMGWNEGEGLGKSNQGRTELVEAPRRVAVAGLGMKGSNYGANAEDTYTETVKKMMQARYKDSE